MTVTAPSSPVSVRPANRLRGRLQMPSDKSIAHRALIVNALADGEAVVELRHPGADLHSTLRCLETLGVSIATETRDGSLRADIGGQWREPVEPLDCGNSGTTMRLLAGALAGQTLTTTLDGDASLRRRPMERVATPLREMGAEVTTTEGHGPMRVTGHQPLRAMTHRLSTASAQLVAAISLAALAAPGTTRIASPGPTRDHTERLLAWMGVAIRRQGNLTEIVGPAHPSARSLRVPGDPSSAAAWLVAATIHPDAEIEIVDVALNPTRFALIEVLRQMGARIEVIQHDHDGPEPIGDLKVRSATHLRPVRIDGNRAAQLIDELPLLAVAMARADGTSELRGAGELRVKESDRIAATVAGLAAIGADVEALADGWRVRRGAPRTADIVTGGDHRIAIAFAVAAGSGAAGEVMIDDPACASVSYPTFWDDLAVVSA